jgi:Na+-transporting methylmalonyl-CoA/oxaloacetate decarboxylase gamma subunit
MDDPVATSLAVTVIGMVILFMALGLLCGLMYLMTALIKDRPGAESEERRGKGANEGAAMRRRAAVIAVALARAELELGATVITEAPEEVSSWRAFHHQRRLTLDRRTRRGG